MFKDIEAVIFDLDGTLVDSMWVWEQIDIQYLTERNLTAPKDIKSQIEGMSFHETAIYFKNQFKLNDSIEKIKDTWNEMAFNKYKYEVPLKKGADSFLKYLKDNNIKIGIATSNCPELANEVLNSHNIKEYFDCIITCGEVNVSKPAPDVYLACADRMGVKYDKCLVFEDVPNGIRGGIAAGMKTCSLDDDFTKDVVDVKKSLADYYIKDYEELLKGNYEVCNA